MNCCMHSLCIHLSVIHVLCNCFYNANYVHVLFICCALKYASMMMHVFVVHWWCTLLCICRESAMHLLCIHACICHASMYLLNICWALVWHSVTHRNALVMCLLWPVRHSCTHRLCTHHDDPCVRYTSGMYCRIIWCITDASVMHLSWIHVYIGYAFVCLFHSHIAVVWYASIMYSCMHPLCIHVQLCIFWAAVCVMHILYMCYASVAHWCDYPWRMHVFVVQ